MTQIGLFLAGLGAVAFIWGAAVMVVANRSYKGPTDVQHRNEKVAHLLGALLLLAGFGLQLVGQLVR